MDKAQLDKLNEPPPPAALKQRKEGGLTLTYLTGWYVIQRMNEIFGPDGWSRGLAGKGLYEVGRCEREIKQKNDTMRTRYDVAMLCEYRVTVHRANALPVTVEDVGHGMGQRYSHMIDSHESAAKEAVTDALKRCCRSLGNALGNCLYDEDWRNDNAPGRSKANDHTTPASGEEPIF